MSANFLFSDKNEHMLMLSAYMDETGHYKDEKQKYVGMAGLIAPAFNWEAFEIKWKAALKLPYIDLPYFHMTDFASRKRVYKDWSEVKRQKVLGKFFRVIETILPLPVGAIIPLEFYRTLDKEHQDYFADPYFLCFQSLLALCTTFLEARQLPIEEKIALIFSEQIEFRHHAQQLYELVRDSNATLKLRGTPPVFRDMRQIMPLQAADIIAYEMYKEFERRRFRADAKPRYGFQRLVKMSERNGYPKPTFLFFDEKEFAMHVEIYEKGKKLFGQVGRHEKLKRAS